jgi:MFS family permease
VRNRGLAPTLVSLGLVVSLISSLGPPLVPKIAVMLHSSVAAAQWSLTATLLVGAVASPVIGRSGDGRYRKEAILLCLAAVTGGGVLAAVATTLPLLIAGRAMQGIGLALVPLAMAAARAHLSAEKATRAVAMLSVAAAAGVGFGYPLTGLIADGFGVDGAFWFSVLLSTAAIGIAAAVIPSSREEKAGVRVDVFGTLGVSAGVLCLLLAFEKGAEWGWAAPWTLALFAASVLVLGVWARHELAAASPLVDLRLLRHPAVATANAAGLALGIAMFLSFTVLVQFVQIPRQAGVGFGSTVFVAGLTLLPLSVGSMLSSWLLPRAQRRFGARPALPLGAVVMGVSVLFFALTADHLWEAFLSMGGIGLGVGFTFAAMPALIIGAIPRSETGSAMGFYQVSRYVGYSIGSGLCVTLIRAFEHHDRPTLAAYRWTLLLAALVCVLVAALTWLFPRGRRDLLRDDDLVQAPIAAPGVD